MHFSLDSDLNITLTCVLIKVLNDIHRKNDASKASILVLLDRCALFDTIDHNVLLDTLEKLSQLMNLYLSEERSQLGFLKDQFSDHCYLTLKFFPYLRRDSWQSFFENYRSSHKSWCNYWLQPEFEQPLKIYSQICLLPPKKLARLEDILCRQDIKNVHLFSIGYITVMVPSQVLAKKSVNQLF